MGRKGARRCLPAQTGHTTLPSMRMRTCANSASSGVKYILPTSTSVLCPATLQAAEQTTPRHVHPTDFIQRSRDVTCATNFFLDFLDFEPQLTSSDRSLQRVAWRVICMDF